MNAKHTKSQIMSSVTLTVILCALPSMSLAGAQWTYLTDMPTPRSVLSAGVVNGKIYTMGGKIMPYRQTTSSSAVEEYDPMTNQWSQKADMPITRANFSISVVNGKIYAIGGYTGQNGNTTPRSSVDVYDPATNTWSQITSMPIGEADHSSAPVDGKIYVIGGDTVQIYDPLTDTWTRGADRPSRARWWAPVSVVDGKIYSIGGAEGPPTYRVVATVEEYDPAKDTWAAKTDIPIATASHACVVVDGKIYVINGNGVTGTVLSLVQVYDPATDTWIEGPRTSIARQLPCAGAVDGTIYLIGGFNPNIDRLVSYGAVEVLDLNPFVDFNGDGAADLDDLLRLIESWGMDDPLVDIGPMPWGDGIVDARDLLVLAEHMVEYDNLVSGLQVSSAIEPLAKKPNNPGSGDGGKKGAEMNLVRVDFVGGNALDSDYGGRIGPLPACSDGHPDAGGLWDYWDPRDPGCDYGGELTSDLSAGGRWHFNTGGRANPIHRWVVFHWTPAPNSSSPYPNLDQVIYTSPVLPDGGPEINPDPAIDNLNMRISADRVFKDNATRQSLNIPIQRGAGSGPIYYLNYLEPLYVVQNYQGDPDLALLTTFGSDGQPDVHQTELVEQVDPTTGESHNANSQPVIGIYSMPLEVILRRVYVP